jgi:hypothetical protein
MPPNDRGKECVCKSKTIFTSSPAGRESLKKKVYPLKFSIIETIIDVFRAPSIRKVCGFMSVTPVASASSVSAAILSATAAAMQELNETAAVTAREAVSGDQVAIRKLARQQEQKQAAAEPTASPTPRPQQGAQVDHLA